MKTCKNCKYAAQVGDTVKIGVKSAELCGYSAGTELVFIQGYFDHDNSLYTETQTAPSIWNEEEKDFDSIYHIFGNDLEFFLDSKIVSGPSMATLNQAEKRQWAVQNTDS